MSQGFTALNGSAALAVVAGPSQVEEVPKVKRRSPKAADHERMQEAVKNLKESIARHGGKVAMPPNITIQNAVIARIIRDGVPEALSHEKWKWTHDEVAFIRHTVGWKHSVIAAYLGRTELACRVARTHVLANKGRPTQQDTRVTQNAPLQPPAPFAGPSRSAGPSGATQESDQLDQISMEELPRWRSWSRRPPIGSPCSPEPVERQSVKLAPIEPATRTTLDMQAAAVRGSAPADHAIKASGLDILADAAAQVDQRRASSRPPYQHALAVTEHDVE
ncbi:hypothetical protein KCU77_g3858, partial [Aureobasidium melanogenum]